MYGQPLYPSYPYIESTTVVSNNYTIYINYSSTCISEHCGKQA